VDIDAQRHATAAAAEPADVPREDVPA
jgi:hypothetical protein